MALGRVLRRGQVTLPQSIRHAAGFKPGDLVSFRATGPGTVEVSALPCLTLAEALECYRIDGPVDGEQDWIVWEAEAARTVLGRGDE